MSFDLEVLRPWTVMRVAGDLDLHPFEVVRILATDGSLPRDLRLRPSDVARVVEAGGLEAWWSELEPSPPRPALIRALARQLLDRGVVDPTWTRVDNLFRGLEPLEQGVVRQAVNVWIRSGAMASRMSARGMELTVQAAAVPDIFALGEQGTGAYSGLLEGE